MNTVHLEDVSAAMWACANWIQPLGREEANKLGGEAIAGFPTKADLVSGLEGSIPQAQSPVAPFFNIVSYIS